MAGSHVAMNSSMGSLCYQGDAFAELSDPEMVEYLRTMKEAHQNQVVRVAQGTTLGPALYLWTHRLTNADVVSVITTTHPSIDDESIGISACGVAGSSVTPRDKWTIVPGSEDQGWRAPMALKGGKAKTESRRRREEEKMRHPLNFPVFMSPLEARSSAVRKELERMGECLLAERDRFMELLAGERGERAHLEGFACCRIQAAYRGYLLRNRWKEVEARLQTRLKIRRSLRQMLRTMGAPFALGRLEKRQLEERRHRTATTCIQAAFRCFLARQTLGKRRAAAFLLRRRRAARTLQCWTRCMFARRALRYELARTLADTRLNAALLIQTQYRRRLGARVTRHRRRVLHASTATMIQGQWRLYKAVQAIRKIKRECLFRSAVAIQRMLRGYVARNKVGRRLARVRVLRETRAAYTLQKFIRRGQARATVERLKRRRRRGACARAVLHLQRACRGFLGRRRAASKRKAVRIDIWRAAREGNAARVDALYYGQGIGGVIFDSQNARDADGNTLLAVVAGGVSTLALVRVVLKWGVDINAVNCRGESALRLAMSKRNVDVVDFLVNHPDTCLDADIPGKSLLHDAAALGLHHLTAQLVSRGLDVNGVDPDNGWSPVHYACHHGRNEIARLLTSRTGTMVDLAGKNGLTPLHLAARGGWEKCVSNLLENHASPFSQDERTQIPAVTAMLHGHASTAKRLLRALSKARSVPRRKHSIASVVAFAVASGDSASKDNPEASGTSAGDPSGGDSNDAASTLDGNVFGKTTSNRDRRRSIVASATGAERRLSSGSALSTSSLSGNDASDGLLVPAVEVSMSPLQSEIVVNAAEDIPGLGPGSGGSGVDVAPGNPSEQWEEVMPNNWQRGKRGERRDSIVEVPDSSRRVLSAKSGQLNRRALEAGLAMGIDEAALAELMPTRWDDDDLRCAMSLAETGQVWCLQSLFALGLDPFCTHPDSGDTFGIAAARGGNREMLELCLETGICFATKNSRGRTALHEAVVRDDLEVAALLLTNPSLSGLEADDLCDPDKDGRTPLHEIAARGGVPTVLLLAAEPESELASSESVVDCDGGVGEESEESRSSGDGDGGTSKSMRDGDGSSSRSDEHDELKEDDGDDSSSTPVPGTCLSHVLPSVTGASARLMGAATNPPSVSAESTRTKGSNFAAQDAEHTLIGNVPTASCTPSSQIRFPRPLSAFAAPVLGDRSDYEQENIHRRSTDSDDMPGTSTEQAKKGVQCLSNLNSDEVVESPWKGLLDANVRSFGAGRCPLHEAATSGSLGAVLSLLDLGADVSAIDAQGYTPLHLAVGPEAPQGSDDEDRMSAMKAPLSYVRGPYVATNTADEAHGEAGKGLATQVVRALLQHGANPTASDASGRTIAMEAVLAGRAGALRELLSAATRRGSYGSRETELRYLSELALVAVSEGRIACLRVLCNECEKQEVLAWQNDEGVPLLALAMAYGQRECVDLLLAGTSPSSPCGDDGNTVLHVTAMARGGVPMLRRLLSGKRPAKEIVDPALLEVKNNMGDTVLMAALRAGRHSAASVLLRASALPTEAAHTFRLAWVIAAALRGAALCPCPSCVLGRTAEEKARLCSSTQPIRRPRVAERNTGGVVVTLGTRSSQDRRSTSKIP